MDFTDKLIYMTCVQARHCLVVIYKVPRDGQLPPILIANTITLNDI